MGGILRGEGVYLLDHGQYAVALAQASHHEQGLVHVVVFHVEAHGTGYLEVGEAIHLGLAQQLAAERVDVALLQPLVDVNDMLELVKEPLVNLRQVVYLVDGVALVHGL